MLSRHAEILFWVGRYLQRAAQTAQLVSITSMWQVERHASTDPWRELLDVLYQERAFHERHDEVTAAGVLEFLVLDRENPGSIASSVAAARDGLRNVRDLVPLDLLEAVNVGHGVMVSTSTDELVSHPVLFLDGVGIQAQRIAGVIHDSMVRSDGYRFLVVGRYLERAEMTLRAVDVNRRAAGDDIQSWVRVLRSVSGLHAFLHSHSALASADDIARFLLTGSDAPCSVQFGLNRCEEELRASFASTSHTTALRALGRLRATIEYGDVPSVTDPALGEFIDRAEAEIRDVSDGLLNDLFAAASVDLHPYEVV
jgi:uncharacterized alpha-E superfamily protein